MIMEQKDIDRELENSKIGDEVVLDVRLSDFRKGIKITRMCRKIVFMLHTTIQVELEIDPRDVSSFEDKYILFSTDEARSYYKELIVKDDKISGDHKITLEYDRINKDLRYSLKIDLGSENEAYFLFEDMSYTELSG
ncbi:MAG: hypothetical protein LBQ14_00070 [Treponema sp.]|nr:hypothetical protein [Treponema sp.]